MSRTSSHIIAFLAGVATGAVLGVLYAPDEGKNTRDKLSFQLGKYRDKLKELINNLVEEEKSPVTLAKAESQRLVADTKEQAERLLGDVEGLIGQIKKGGN